MPCSGHGLGKFSERPLRTQASSSTEAASYPMTRLRCAILDDYFNVALTLADWSGISDRVDINVFNHPFASEQAAASALSDFEIVCAIMERTTC